MEENNNNNYSYEPYQVKKQKNSFSKSVLIPFASGIIGAGLVIGTCFSVPSIKSKLLSIDSKSTTSTTSAPTITTNSNLISLVEYSETSVNVAQKVLPSIVGINVEYQVNTIFSNKSSSASASGSGIIISEDGYILTNDHIVSSSNSSSFYQMSKATKITVNLYNDSTAYEAEVIGTDELTDLAVIKIDKTGLTPAELGDSDSVQIGEFAMAIGNPLGLTFSVSSGIISATNREITDTDGKKYTLLQTDAAINSGNSGGALVNSKGQVIGLNTLKISGNGVEGMGFAIPINATKEIYSQLIEYNKVKRPYIGISTIDVDNQTASYYNLAVGVYVDSVSDFSPAQKAGIKVGDVITKINDVSVATADELNAEKNSCSIGDQITLTLIRNGQEMSISLTLEEEP